MLNRNMAQDSALRELLTDLRHDLAKYLCLPIRMLPRDVDARTLHAALERALLFTRQSPHQTLTAREIYAAVRAAATSETLRVLDAAVDRALAWQIALDDQRALDRASIERDFLAVESAIDACLEHSRDEAALD
jgi:hypothetical protein